jgi:hypothetical protein
LNAYARLMDHVVASTGGAVSDDLATGRDVNLERDVGCKSSVRCVTCQFQTGAASTVRAGVHARVRQ